MQNKWLVETLAELAFVREPMRFYGYGMEKGIILIADDTESALLIMSMLEAYLDAVEIKFDGRKKNQSLQYMNYQMGVRIYRRCDDERKLLDFLEEREFLPVVITVGWIPEALVGMGYAFRCTATAAEFMEAKEKYKEFSDFIKREVSMTLEVVQAMSEAPDLLIDKREKYGKYKKFVKNFMTVFYIWQKIYEKSKTSEEKIQKKKEMFEKNMLREIVIMDRYEGGFDVQDVVRECFKRQAGKGKIGLRLMEEKNSVDAIENCILYDDDFYYVTDDTLRAICAPLLETVSFVQLKNEMASSGMVDCNDGNIKNFTKKKVIGGSYGWQKRVRVIWIKKESLMSNEGLLLENIWEDKIC